MVYKIVRQRDKKTVSKEPLDHVEAEAEIEIWKLAHPFEHFEIEEDE